MAKSADAEEVQQPLGRVANLLEGFLDDESLSEIGDIARSTPPKEGKKETPAKQVKSQKPEEEESEEEEPEEEEEEEVEKPADKKEKGQKTVNKDDKKKKDNEEEEGEEEEDEDEDEKEEPELKNKFGFRLNKKDEKKGGKLEIKSFDELPATIKSKYGQDVKDVKALSKFLETSVDKWRSDSQSLEKVKKEKDNAIAVFEQLPPELLDAVKMHYEGQDFRKAFEGNVKIDFSKPVDKHKSKTLVNAFFPGEFEDEDFDAEEPSKELKIAIKASEKEYIAEKNTREQRAKDRIEQAGRKDKAYKESVSSSVTALKSAFPDMGADVLTDVEHTLSSGALMSEFFNPDGTYKPHAAKALMLAKHGEELIEELMQIAERRGESNANEEIVKRSPSKPKAKKGGGKEQTGKEGSDRIDQLLPQGLFNKRTF